MITTKFIVQVKPLIERQAEIAHEVSTAQRNYRFHGYRSESLDLPVIRVPLSLPIYRMENYRTRLQQRAWIKDFKVPPNYFFTGQENESIQNIQHKFLWELANEEKKNIAQINQVLMSEGQKEPILITSSGVVVNGNRRLAAMREIYKSDTDSYATFMHVDCMVLPSGATEDDLKEIEVKLQMTPETRLPYDWISECLAIQDLFERGKDADAIANLMGLKDPSKVRTKLRMLTEINLYLNEWKKDEGGYKQVLDVEQIINELTIRFARKEGTELEIARRIGWILLDQRGKDGRVYNYKEVVGNLLTDISNKIQETFPNETSVDNANVDVENNGEEIELDISNEQISSEEGILEFLKSSNNDDQLQETIIELCDIVVEARKQQRNGQAAYRAINDANTKLLAVELASADRNTYEGIRNQLISISQRTDRLIQELQSLEQGATV